MDQILTEQDVKALEEFGKGFAMWTFQAERFLDFLSRARALLAHRDLMIKERDDAVLNARRAVNAEIKANEELTEIRHALGGFAGPTYGISERVKKVVADRDFYAKQASEADDTIKLVTAERDTQAARVKELEGAKNEFGFNPRMMEMVTVMTSMAEELEKTSAELAAVKSDRDGIIAQAKETYTNFGFLCDIRDVLKTTKFGDNLVAAIKAMKEELDQARKDTEPDPNPVPEGHMIHIPAEYCGDSSRMHAYADGYLAGKGAK